jgi:serine/threonine-protein kinase
MPIRHEIEASNHTQVVSDAELIFDDADATTLAPPTFGRDALVGVGELVARKFCVESVPRRTGLALVVQARHLELNLLVTLKFLIPDACAYPELVQRFVREARAAVRVGGEHVARVTDIGRLESGAPYMVREFLRGPDLEEVLKVRGRLPVAEAVDYVIQAAAGVVEGHALDIVHRNLRMTTLVVTRRSDGSPLVKVFDFGAAEALHVDPFTERSVALVGTSAIMSSLPYLSPEQIRDPHDVDVRADVYALGAILHELLTGQALYSADNAPSLLASVAADAAAAVRDLRPEVPAELDHVVLRCLAKNRAIRYSTIADLVAALEGFGSRDSASSVERVRRMPRHSAAPARLKSAPQPGTGQRRPTPGLAANREARGPAGTLVMPPVLRSTIVTAPAVEDVTVMQPLASYVPLVEERARTSVPPPLRSSTLARNTPSVPRERGAATVEVQHHDVTVAAPTPSAAGYAAFAPKSPPVGPEATVYVTPHRPPSSQTRTTMMPPSRRSFLPVGMTRSWTAGAEDETVASLRAKKRRNVAMGVFAAVGTLALFVVFRSPAAATAPPAAAPAPVAAPSPPPIPPFFSVAEAASVAPSFVAPPAAVATRDLPPVAAAAPPGVRALHPVAQAQVVPTRRPLAAPPRPAAKPVSRSAQEPAAPATQPTELAGRDLFDSPE